MTSSLYEETILEGHGDHEERELSPAATRKNDESPDNPVMKDIVIEKRESEGNEILSMKIDTLSRNTQQCNIRN